MSYIWVRLIHAKLPAYMIEVINDNLIEEKGMCPVVNATETWKDVKIVVRLSKKQRHQVQNLLKEYEDIFTDVPGRTYKIEHDFETVNEIPIRQKSYRLPQSLRENVKAKLDTMLEHKVIQPSKSP